MHCPKCGQKQFSDEAHFCKNCGFALDRVKELLTGDGASPVPQKESQESGESPRRKGVRQAVKLFFICLLLAVITTRSGNPRANFLPMLFFMAAILRMIYAVFFQQGAPQKKKQDSAQAAAPLTTENLGASTRGFALPQSQSVPVAAFNTRRADTAEMVRPPSVTEHTTKLLNESQDSE